MQNTLLIYCNLSSISLFMEITISIDNCQVISGLKIVSLIANIQEKEMDSNV